MKRLILLLLTGVLSLPIFAAPTCLATYECMEYDGQIIDLRSSSRRMLETSRFFDRLEEDLPKLTKQEFTRIVAKEDARYFIPLELRGQDAIILAGALSLGVVVFANDREIMDFIQENRTETTQKVSNFGNIMGREAIAPIAAGSYFIGAVLRNGKLKKIGLFTVGTALATQIVTEVFKKTFNRIRPNGSDSPYEFFEEDNFSFFSGHSSAAFSLATVIAETYKDKPLIPYLAYGVAAVTAYARMQDKKHWASDVLMGGIAGHLITKIIMRSFDINERSGSGLMITPMVGQINGVSIRWSPKNNNSKMECSKHGLEGNNLVKACVEELFQKSNL